MWWLLAIPIFAWYMGSVLLWLQDRSISREKKTDGHPPCPLFTWQTISWIKFIPWKIKLLWRGWKKAPVFDAKTIKRLKKRYRHWDMPYWFMHTFPRWIVWIWFDWASMKHDKTNWVFDIDAWLFGNGVSIRFYSKSARVWYSLPEDERIYDE